MLSICIEGQWITVATSCDGYGWLAVDDRTYDGPGSPIGIGATEQAAINALIEAIELRAGA